LLQTAVCPEQVGVVPAELPGMLPSSSTSVNPMNSPVIAYWPRDPGHPVGIVARARVMWTDLDASERHGLRRGVEDRAPDLVAVAGAGANVEGLAPGVARGVGRGAEESDMRAARGTKLGETKKVL